MSRFILDTNHASRLLDGDPAIGARVAHRAGQVSLCVPSVGELWLGVYKGDRAAESRKLLLDAIGLLGVVEFDLPAAEEYGRIMAEQRRKGRPVPHVDAQIAAIARCRSCVVLTADRHFDLIDDLIDGITVENWLA